jgi:lipopolysaccharide transport system ATP-binding protein
MDDDVVLGVYDVSKKFSRNLKSLMKYGFYDIGRNVLGINVDSGKLRMDEFWAVKDISFELHRGETLGIIGPNGSGKSTMLKMLNGIYMPDKGTIEVRGKVGALIEVGAGFHPMLSGRENIYVNGAILGMSKKEIDEKFDEIVAFADIGDFLDSPIKSYSSGMHVRLGFAIAVHCEPDILLIDEVLAVGDGVFRNKCYKRLNEIKEKKNVAIVFVSHDLYTVEKFCDRGILIDNGKIKSKGEKEIVIRDYQYIITQSIQKGITDVISDSFYCTKDVEITNVEYLDINGKQSTDFSFGATIRIRVGYKTKQIVYEPVIQIALFNSNGIKISNFGTHLDQIKINSIQGEGSLECRFENIPLLPDKFFVNVSFYDKNHEILLDYWRGSTMNSYFQVLPNVISTKMGEYAAICHFNARWIFDSGKVN